MAIGLVELVQRLKPDLLVLDLSMPVMNGLDAARRIVAISLTTQMVLFTSHANEQLAAEAKIAGIQAVLHKDGDASLRRLVKFLRQLSGTVRAA